MRCSISYLRKATISSSAPCLLTNIHQAFPFDPSPDWTHFYSSGKEIHEYIKRTAKKWDLDRDVYLNTKVTSAVWQEDAAQWKVTVECEGVRRDEYAEVLISAQGALE